MAQNLKNQIAVISGGLGDIGKAIALELARRGADVALGDIQNPAAAREIILDIEALGARAAYHQVDAADADAVENWLNSVEKQWGIADLIIPNAAIVKIAPLTEISPQDWHRQLNVNLGGAFFLAQNAARRLVKAGRGGRIVFVGSWAAHAPHINMIPYSVSKAGLRMLCRCMALELAPHQILVNEVAPGYVDAGLSGKIFDQTPALREEARATVPNRELITAAQVAAQVAYLCDPENRHMVGATLLMDGGLSLRR